MDDVDQCAEVLAGRRLQLRQIADVIVCQREPGMIAEGASPAGTGADASGTEGGAIFALSALGVGATADGSRLNHPSSGASDGTRLVVADRFNNRVLLYNSIPTGPTDPDVILGQPNHTSTLPGDGPAEMNWPGAVEMTPDGKILVADTENGRIMIWNTPPMSDGEPADVIVDLERLGVQDPWPWGLWTDGTTLIATNTRGGQVLIWETFPFTGTERPQITSSDSVGTPRNITSNGSSFLIGDENGRFPSCWGMGGENAQSVGRQSHIWVDRLPIGEPDGCVPNWYQGEAFGDGLIALAAGGESVHVWEQFPVDDATAAARIESQPGPGQGSPGGGGVLHAYLGGDGGDVVVAGDSVFFISYNGNRVTAWAGAGMDADSVVGRNPDFAVNVQDVDDLTLLRDGFIQNPVLASNGEMLAASSDYDRQLHVWTTMPTENGALADVIYVFGQAPWDNAMSGSTLITGGRDVVNVWNDFEPGALPDATMFGQVGSISISEVKGVAYDGEFFAVSDRNADRVFVFDGIPDDGQDPVLEIDYRGPGRLDMQDAQLLITPYEGGDVVHVDIRGGGVQALLGARTNLPMQAVFTAGTGSGDDSGAGAGAGRGGAIADTAVHRVLVWDTIDDALRGAAPSREIGEGGVGARPQTSATGFYVPASILDLGDRILVGEFKFSNRILVFAN